LQSQLEIANSASGMDRDALLISDLKDKIASANSRLSKIPGAIDKLLMYEPGEYTGVGGDIVKKSGGDTQEPDILTKLYQYQAQVMQNEPEGQDKQTLLSQIQEQINAIQPQ